MVDIRKYHVTMHRFERHRIVEAVQLAHPSVQLARENGATRRHGYNIDIIIAFNGSIKVGVYTI